MSGRHKWSDIMAKQFPEVINARFPEGTRERIRQMADKSLMEYAAENPDVSAEKMPLLSPSVIVRRAVLEYLEREESR